MGLKLVFLCKEYLLIKYVYVYKNNIEKLFGI